jgi:hypothetical protein
VAGIYKNNDNSAVFTFQARGKSLPFGFAKNHFEISVTLNLTIQRNE